MLDDIDLSHYQGMHPSLESFKPGSPGYVAIKDIFDEECSHLKIDTKLAKVVSGFVIGFANRNEDHVAFFGGNLMGVQRVRFTTEDPNMWMDDIIEGDDYALKDMIIGATDIVA